MTSSHNLDDDQQNLINRGAASLRSTVSKLTSRACTAPERATPPWKFFLFSPGKVRGKFGRGQCLKLAFLIWNHGRIWHLQVSEAIASQTVDAQLCEA